MLTGFHGPALQLPHNSAKARAGCRKSNSTATDDCIAAKHKLCWRWARDSQFTPLDRFRPFQCDELLE